MLICENAPEIFWSETIRGMIKLPLLLMFNELRSTLRVPCKVVVPVTVMLGLLAVKFDKSRNRSESVPKCRLPPVTDINEFCRTSCESTVRFPVMFRLEL